MAQTLSRECLSFRARRLSRVITRIYDDAIRRHGLTAAQLNLLAAIALHDSIKQSELVARLSLEKSTLSRNLSRMIDHGWVRAEAAAGEARGQQLSVTAAGAALLCQVLPAWREAQSKAHALVGPDGLRALDDMAESIPS